MNDGLKDAGRGLSDAGSVWARGNHTRRGLVVAELALSVMLLVGAALLIRSFVRLQRVWPGFEARGVLTFEVTTNGPRYAEPQRVIDTYRDLSSSLARLPGAEAAGAVSALPLSRMFSWGPITIEGRTPAPGEGFINVDQRIVAADYFAALRIPLVAGRLFDDHDVRSAARVVIVDAYMAEQLWPHQSALGKRLRTGGAGSTSPWLTVVGVVGRVKQYSLDADSRIAMYFPHAQYPTRAMNVVVRTTNDPSALAPAVQSTLHAIDPDLPPYHLRTMDERVGESLARRRFAMLLLTIFAAVALGLAASGVYGVMSYLVAQSRRELGIRLALGATPHGILMLIVRRGLSVAAIGVALGLAGAAGLTRFLRSLLFGVGSADPLTFLATPAILVAVALLATYAPARRAARIDPIHSLRIE